MQEAERRGVTEEEVADEAAALEDAEVTAEDAEEPVEDTPEEATASNETDAEASTDAFDETSGFPENFPQVGRLENAGVMSLSDLREYADDFTEISGIGDSYAEAIENALAEFDETGSVSG